MEHEKVLKYNNFDGKMGRNTFWWPTKNVCHTNESKQGLNDHRFHLIPLWVPDILQMCGLHPPYLKCAVKLLHVSKTVD